MFYVACFYLDVYFSCILLLKLFLYRKLLENQAQDIDEQFESLKSEIKTLRDENEKQICPNFDKCFGNGNKNKNYRSHRSKGSCPWEASEIVEPYALDASSMVIENAHRMTIANLQGQIK